MITENIVTIRKSGEQFIVACEPPDPKFPPRTFDTPRAAWGCAGGIKLATGRRKVDLTDIQTTSTKGGRATV